METVICEICGTLMQEGDCGEANICTNQDCEKALAKKDNRYMSRPEVLEVIFLKLYGLVCALALVAIASVYILPVVRDSHHLIMVEKEPTILFFIGFSFLILGLVVAVTTTILTDKKKQK